MYEVKHTPQSSYNTELYHHGVLGMKWGIRRYQDYGEGGYNPKKKGTFKNKVERHLGSKHTNTLKEARSKDVNKMSDDELRRYNNRLQAERNYAELTKGGAGETKQIAKKVLITIATSVVTGIGIETGKNFVKNLLGLNSTQKK